jgi:hypothetical protein
MPAVRALAQPLHTRRPMSGGRIVGRIPFKSPQQRDEEARQVRRDRWRARLPRWLLLVDAWLARRERR